MSTTKQVVRIETGGQFFRGSIFCAPVELTFGTFATASGDL